jgi:hypothetical protein
MAKSRSWLPFTCFSLRSISADTGPFTGLDGRHTYGPAIVGLAVTMDPVSAAASVQYLSEGPYSSGLLLATATVI